MKQRDKTILLVVLILCSVAGRAQTPPSLKEQLEAQYKPAKLRGVIVEEPGTVLVIKKGGIYASPPKSGAMCPARYEDGNLKGPSGLCLAMVKGGDYLSIGAKVYIRKIDVNPGKDRVQFFIIECDSCNGQSRQSSYKADVSFNFPKGSLQSMSPSQVEDVIANVLAFEEGTEPPKEAPGPPVPPISPPGEVLTNADVLKMVKAKLGDDLIISKIKSSGCNFDISVDGMVGLKTEGASDAVIQAMQQCQAQNQ